MQQDFFSKFSLRNEKEELENVIANVENGVAFRGTNLWILIFAIFVASLGLNVNSTAVIIGAMLISPLMGPIMGIGLGIGINDAALLRKAIYNFGIATFVALITSTIFFLVSPLNEAHSEILARTSPNIYDVLIAFFGGLAGIVATTSKLKGNVIPGVAIATALMPPLCTAGYGLATFQFQFFLGAFYLFIINTVFIALSTFIIVRILHFPYRHLKDARAEKIAHRIVWFVVIVTLLPSIYFGYDMIKQGKFNSNANRFINNEAHFPNDYLLNKKVDAKEKRITLIFGGQEISKEQIDLLRSQLPKYSLDTSCLEVKQGFAYLQNNNTDEIQKSNEQLNQLSLLLNDKDKEIKKYQSKLDSIARYDTLSKQLFGEIKAQNNNLQSAIIQPAKLYRDSGRVDRSFVILLTLTKNILAADKIRMENWLKVRLKTDEVKLIIQ